jgi:hypothetical protein
MKLSYCDLLGDHERKEVKAEITTEHPLSHYGQPVILLEDGGGLDYQSAALLDYRLVEATEEEAELLKQWKAAMPPME